MVAHTLRNAGVLVYRIGKAVRLHQEVTGTAATRRHTVHWPGGLRLLLIEVRAPSLAASLARKSESEAATGSLLFGLGVTRSDYNHNMSDSFTELTPANSVDSEADPLSDS